jgi:hypothetical protein
MSKNNGFGKFLLFCAAVGAVFAGIYYYLTKRDERIAEGFDDDDFDDFDDFEDDDIDTTSDFKFGSRKYVDITSGDEDADSKEDDKDEKPAADEKDSDEPDESEEFFDDEK